MNKNLIYRIVGALSSALIVVSVFLTYYSVYDYNYSLWTKNGETSSLYLPIMIIAFGVIGIILFATNFKTEFCYATTGAILFYVISETFNYIRQGSFGSLSIGYYTLCIGCVMTGIMTFVVTAKNKIKRIEPIDSTATNETNKIYDTVNIIPDQSNSNNKVEPIPQVSSDIFNSPIVEPLKENPVLGGLNIPDSPISESVMPTTPVEPIKESPVLGGLNIPTTPVSETVIPTTPVEPIKENPVLSGLNIPDSPISEPAIRTTPVEPIKENPVLSGLNIPTAPISEPAIPTTPVEPIKENPVLSGLNIPTAPISEPVVPTTPVEPIKENPVLSGLNIPTAPISEPVMPTTPVEPVKENPVLAGLNVAQPQPQQNFTSSILGSTNQSNDTTPLSNFMGGTQPQQNNGFMGGSMQQQGSSTQTQATDIFGQPLN